MFKSGLAATRRTDDGHHLSLLDVDIDAVGGLLGNPFTVNDFETSLNEMTVGETAFAPIGSGEVALFNTAVMTILPARRWRSAQNLGCHN